MQAKQVDTSFTKLFYKVKHKSQQSEVLFTQNSNLIEFTVVIGVFSANFIRQLSDLFFGFVCLLYVQGAGEIKGSFPAEKH